jgi:hypothetical protein
MPDAVRACAMMGRGNAPMVIYKALHLLSQLQDIEAILCLQCFNDLRVDFSQASVGSGRTEIRGGDIWCHEDRGVGSVG